MKLLILPLLDILIGSWRYKLTLKINIWLDDAWNEILWMLFTTLLFFLQGISSMYFASGHHTFLSSSTIRDDKTNKIKKQIYWKSYVCICVCISISSKLLAGTDILDVPHLTFLHLLVVPRKSWKQPPPSRSP